MHLYAFICIYDDVGDSYVTIALHFYQCFIHKNGLKWCNFQIFPAPQRSEMGCMSIIGHHWNLGLIAKYEIQSLKNESSNLWTERDTFCNFFFCQFIYIDTLWCGRGSTILQNVQS